MKHLVAAACTLGLLAACGGGGNSGPTTPQTPPPTTTLAPATLADLSAVASSPQADGKVGCRSPVRVQVRVTNNAASSVVLLGVERSSRALSGGCNPAPPFTFTPFVATVGAHQTATALDGTLFGESSGCCIGGRNCSGTCTFEESLKVLTRVGDVPAGKFRYQITFNGCSVCPDAAASGGAACPPALPAP